MEAVRGYSMEPKSKVTYQTAHLTSHLPSYSSSAVDGFGQRHLQGLPVSNQTPSKLAEWKPLAKFVS